MKTSEQVYGLRAVIEALQADKTINKIFLQKGLQGELFDELRQLADIKNVSTSYVPKEKLNRLTKNNHQGAVAQISPVAFKEFSLFMEDLTTIEQPFVLLLDGVSDVRNFGAIIRTAECAGVHGIVIPKTGSAPINEDTVKTSAGAAFNIPIAKVDHLKDAIFYLQSSNIKVYAATEKAQKTIYETSLSESCAIIMGAEDKGISASILKSADAQIKLPILGKIGSLNVSVACGAVLYEVVRQRTTD